MRIILGCDPLLTPLTGIGHYTKELGKGLLRHDYVDLKLFAHAKFFSTDLLRANDQVCGQISAKQPKTSVKSRLTANLRNKLAASPTVVKCYQQFVPHLMKFSLRQHGDRIFHSPNFTLPPFDGKRIVTIHDLSTVRFPQFHPKSRVEFVNQSIDYATQHADHIITDSEFVRKEILNTFSVSPDKVTSVPLGAGKEFMPRTEEECQAVLAFNGLQFKQFFLFVSTIEPRKNLLTLLYAFSQYRAKNRDGLPLVIIGGQGWNNSDIIEKIAELSAKGWVSYIGYAPQAQLPILYSAARALLFPSLYEGFGLPVLEAMQSGTAVMTSVDSSMSEITSDSAALIWPHDIDKLSFEITHLEQDSRYVDCLVEKGLLRSKQFSWDKCVGDTLSLYKQLEE